MVAESMDALRQGGKIAFGILAIKYPESMIYKDVAPVKY
jgi:hypothetical protein